MSEVVQMTTDRGVALLTLNRPQRLNAWTTEMEHAYFRLLDECAASEEVRHATAKPRTSLAVNEPDRSR